MKCIKCEGTGILEAFAHIAAGVCFACVGTGNIPPSKKHTLSFAKAFIYQFDADDPIVRKEDLDAGGDGFFPKYLTAVKLYAYAHLNSTAEMQVLLDDNFYYVGQPICRSSIWFKIPIDSWVDFKKYYQKVYRVSLEKPC